MYQSGTKRKNRYSMIKSSYGMKGIPRVPRDDTRIKGIHFPSTWDDTILSFRPKWSKKEWNGESLSLFVIPVKTGIQKFYLCVFEDSRQKTINTLLQHYLWKTLSSIYSLESLSVVYFDSLSRKFDIEEVYVMSVGWVWILLDQYSSGRSMRRYYPHFLTFPTHRRIWPSSGRESTIWYSTGSPRETSERSYFSNSRVENPNSTKTNGWYRIVSEPVEYVLLSIE